MAYRIRLISVKLMPHLDALRTRQCNSLQILAVSQLLWKKRKAYSLGIPKTNWLME